ncbi:MAG: recombinase family protein [Bacilli bacterium]|jgi:DNA invertase Pin-like site-specific DNA recombinase|nr:recombinase family protein [Bacilli bacterium]
MQTLVTQEKQPEKAVMYLRFSSENQTEQSIEGQRSECQSYADSHGLKVIGEYVDRAKSATSDPISRG